MNKLLIAAALLLAVSAHGQDFDFSFYPTSYYLFTSRVAPDSAGKAEYKRDSVARMAFAVVKKEGNVLSIRDAQSGTNMYYQNKVAFKGSATLAGIEVLVYESVGGQGERLFVCPMRGWISIRFEAPNVFQTFHHFGPLPPGDYKPKL